MMTTRDLSAMSSLRRILTWGSSLLVTPSGRKTSFRPSPARRESMTSLTASDGSRYVSSDSDGCHKRGARYVPLKANRWQSL